MRQEYHSLYCLKAIGVLFVLMIHFHCYKSQYLEPLYRCGVPIFFIISGFFLYTNDFIKQKSRLKRSVFKIIKYIIFFNLIYYLLYWLTEGKSRIDNLTGIIRLVVYGDSVSGHLWFLTSYLWTIIFFIICKTLKLKDSIIYIIAAICMVEGLMEEQYAFTLGGDFSIQTYYLPWFTSSLPMMAVGYATKKHEIRIVNWMKKHGKIKYGCLIVFLFLTYIEHRLLCMSHHFSGTFMISTFFATMAMFLYCVAKPNMGKNTYMETIGKEHSGNIYYWQFFPYNLLIASVFPKDILSNLGLFIMFAALLAWSYGINFIDAQLKKYRFIK